MKFNKIILLTLIILYYWSCSGSQKDGEQMKYIYNKASIEINKDSIPISFNLLNQDYSDFYSNLDSIRLIKLETTNEALIGKINRLFIVDDTIFAVDLFKTKSIFAFDLSGNYLYKICKLGGGPGEYQSINIVHIDNKGIFILDWLTWKIIRYDHQGNMISEQRAESHPQDFINLENDKMIFAYNYYKENALFQIEFVDNQLKLEDTAFPFKNTRLMAGTSLSRFQKLDQRNSILYCYPFCDTIFEINDKNIFPKYHLSLYSPTQVSSLYENTKNLNNKEFYARLSKDDIVRIFNFFELKDNLYVNYSKGYKAYTSLISKKTKKSYHSIAGDEEERISYQPFYVSGHCGNTLLAFIDQSFSILTKENKTSFYSNLRQKDVNLIREMEESENNPILCMIYIKESL